MKYCVFVDVLGYGSIVTDSNRTESSKLNILNAIYSNLAAQMMIDINETNQNALDPVYIKSFSDCFYLESTDNIRVLHVVKNIFRNSFTFYGADDYSDLNYTGLIRGGVTLNWTRRFNDLAGVVTNHQLENPVGLGVAEAYYLSEKTNLSGMRIILKPEVFRSLKTTSVTRNNTHYFKHSYSLNGADYFSYYKHITKNEAFHTVDLYELIWSYDTMNTCTSDGMDVLQKIKPTFSNRVIRHYHKTAQVLLDGLILTDCKKNIGDHFNKMKVTLTKESQQNTFGKFTYGVREFLKS
ncbi:MAG: hypothetical protein KDE33_16665, partial [Bacteroidetes bacterium]|nr:hypothetical protein [Bacteroidota bacterium]